MKEKIQDNQRILECTICRLPKPLCNCMEIDFMNSLSSSYRIVKFVAGEGFDRTTQWGKSPMEFDEEQIGRR